MKKSNFSKKIAMLGHIIPVKRVYEVILMLAELRGRGFDYTLHIGGQPKKDFVNQRYYASILEAIENLGLGQCIFFDGWVDPAKWLPKMDIFLSNSYWEGQQNALIEAMASGCYCLCHFWGGAEEILPAECLYSSETSMLEKIIQYSEMQNDEKRFWQNRMRSIAVKKFNLTDSVRKYRELIQSMI